MGKITVEVKINTFGTMKHPNIISRLKLFYTMYTFDYV